jgi:hypothetical protein
MKYFPKVVEEVLKKLWFALEFIPTLGMKCSHVGNELFPRWEWNVPLLGMVFVII